MEHDQIIEMMERIQVRWENIVKMSSPESDFVKEMIEGTKNDIKLMAQATFCMKELIDPWHCQHCGWTAKVPPDQENLHICPKCQNYPVMPYGYLEQARMSAQLVHLQKCVAGYAKSHQYGGPAKLCLQAVSGVGDEAQKKIQKSCLQSHK